MKWYAWLFTFYIFPTIAAMTLVLTDKATIVDTFQTVICLTVVFLLFLTPPKGK